MLNPDGHIPEEQLWAYHDEALPPEERAVVEAHLGSCEACSAEVAEMASLLLDLRSLPMERAPDGFLEGVQERVRAAEAQWWRLPWLKALLKPGRMAQGAVVALATITVVIVVIRSPEADRLEPDFQPRAVQEKAAAPVAAPQLSKRDDAPPSREELLSEEGRARPEAVIPPSEAVTRADGSAPSGGGQLGRAFGSGESAPAAQVAAEPPADKPSPKAKKRKAKGGEALEGVFAPAPPPRTPPKRALDDGASAGGFSIEGLGAGQALSSFGVEGQKGAAEKKEADMVFAPAPAVSDDTVADLDAFVAPEPIADAEQPPVLELEEGMAEDEPMGEINARESRGAAAERTQGSKVESVATEAIASAPRRRLEFFDRKESAATPPKRGPSAASSTGMADVPAAAPAKPAERPPMTLAPVGVLTEAELARLIERSGGSVTGVAKPQAELAAATLESDEADKAEMLGGAEVLAAGTVITFQAPASRVDEIVAGLRALGQLRNAAGASELSLDAATQPTDQIVTISVTLVAP